MKRIKLNDFVIANDAALTLIAGPCVIEDEKICYNIATRIKKLSKKFNIPTIFKASYDKANRSSINSYRGVGIKEGLRILKQIKETLNLPVITDVHCCRQVEQVAEVVDIIQIPAFLCRQTDLIVEAAKTKKIINVKKGQFLAPWDVKNVIEKITRFGNENIMLTERGVSFGYNNLVVDFKSFFVLKEFGYPVIFDATHSLQLPGANNSHSGGQIEYFSTLSRAATATAIAGLFVEVHINPKWALSDATTTIKLSQLEKLLPCIIAIDNLIKKEVKN